MQNVTKAPKEAKKLIAEELMLVLRTKESITRKEAFQLILSKHPDIRPSHVDEWARDHLVSAARGVWKRKSGTVVEVSSPPPTGATKRKPSMRGSRLTEDERTVIAKAVANFMFLETPALLAEALDAVEKSFGWTKKFPANLVTTLAPVYEREYQELIANAIADKPVVVTERIVLDLSKASPLDLLKELLTRAPETLNLLSSVNVPTEQIIEAGYLSTINEPKAKAPKYKVLITGLLPGQITALKQRPKILANNARLDLHFLTKDSTTLRIPQFANIVLSLRKMCHSLYHSLIAFYGREKIHVLDGLHGIEETLLNGLMHWTKQ